MAAHFFYGSWEIGACIPQKHTPETDVHSLEGACFRLDDSGDVTWHDVSEQAAILPLCKCETYEVYTATSMIYHLRFGAYAGHVIEFRIEHFVEWSDSMIMVCEGWCTINCRKKPEVNFVSTDSPFSLWSALENGCFSDLTIVADNKKEFLVHTYILKLIGDGIDWENQPLDGLPELVLHTILHWLYAECLPTGLTEETAQNVITAISKYPTLDKLSKYCQLYIKNKALERQIVTLVNDMHDCCAQVNDCFSVPMLVSSDNLVENPGRLAYALKQSIRETAVAGVKLILLCDLFTKQKNNISNEEREEIVRYARARLPVFMSQLSTFLMNLKVIFSNFSLAQRQQLALHFVPEIEVVWDTFSNIIKPLKIALEQIIEKLSRREGMDEASLSNVLFKRELCKLRDFHGDVTSSLELLLHKKESFNEMSESQKVRSVARTLDQLIEELPLFSLRLDDVRAALDDKLEWREFKFCFKVGTSKVSAVLEKFLNHRDALRNGLLKLCEIVQRDVFTNSLVTLGLLDGSQLQGYHDEPLRHTEPIGPVDDELKFSLTGSLRAVPTSSNSNLSKRALQLLRSGICADLEFEVINSTCDDSTPSSASSPIAEKVAKSPDTANSEIICAHRAIVAARCDWFRRALSSGMREAISKRITIHDTNAYLFRVFLDYLYSGKLITEVLSNEQLIDLLLISDRYEMDALKLSCENGLKRYIDHDTVLCLISMAYRYNAQSLKSTCFNYVVVHPDLILNELFNQLPEDVQTELYTAATYKRVPTNSKVWSKYNMSSSYGKPEAVPDSEDLEDIICKLHINEQTNQIGGIDSPASDPEPDSRRLNACVDQLREIIGSEVGVDELVEVTLAADYDINRALNFYYAT